MKKFKIEITELAKREIEIDADNIENAISKAWDIYWGDDTEYDNDDFTRSTKITEAKSDGE